MTDEALQLDPRRSAVIIQDLQNDVIIEGGAFADSGAPAHATAQNVVANVAELARRCRAAGVPVIHVWYIVEAGAKGLKLNAPLFQGVHDANALVRGSWGAAPAAVGNINWGGPDWNQLFICASDSVYRLQCQVAGNRLPYMR